MKTISNEDDKPGGDKWTPRTIDGKGDINGNLIRNTY
jgi:hypothetical protein